jgi:mercuric ion transport protein
MAMKDRALITTRATGAVLAEICCAAPFLAVMPGAFGLTAWLAKAPYAVIRALILGAGLIKATTEAGYPAAIK